MSHFLFLQRFVDGAPTPLPYDELIDTVTAFGTLHSIHGDTELVLVPPPASSQPGVGDRALLIGNESEGVSCIAVEYWLGDPELARFAFALMQRFGVVVFDDRLDQLLLHPDTPLETLPAALRAAAGERIRRVGAAERLWPSGIRVAAAAPRNRPVLRDPSDADGRRQPVDHVDSERGLIVYDVELHPEAGSPSVGRAIRHALARVVAIARQIGGIRLEVNVRHSGSALHIFEARPVADEAGASIAFVTPPPGDVLPGGPMFVASRDVDAEAHGLAAHCMDIAKGSGLDAEFGVEAAVVLQHVIDAARQQLAAAPEDERAEHAVAIARTTGAYWGELLRRQLGATWGHFDGVFGRRIVLQTYTGRIIDPFIDAFDQLHGDALEPLAARLTRLIREVRSRSLDHDDYVANVHPYCALLRGQVAGQFGSIPLHDYLPVAELDFSPNSLFALERWIRQFGAQRHQFDSAAAIGVMHTAAAYLGEVIRAQAPSEWRWENYHDYFDGTPGLPDLPYQPTTAAVLLGFGHLLFPIAAIGECIADPAAPSLLEWIGERFKEAGTDWALPSPTRVESDDESAYRLDVHPHNAADYAEHLAKISADSGFQFDFSTDSLGEVDRFIANVCEKQQGTLDVAAAEILYLLACYAGEVLVRSYAARWRSTRATRNARRSNAAVLLETQGGSLIDPISKAFDLARYKGVDSFALLALQVGGEFALRQQYPIAAEVAAASGADADLSLAGIRIAECVASLPADERDYVNITAAPWLPRDPLARVLEAAPILLAHGQAVWAHIVQVNTRLYSAAEFNDSGLPGEVIYDPSGAYTPDQLAPVAKQVFKLRGTQASIDPASTEGAQLLALANHLDAETTRAFGMPVPPSLCPQPLRLSTLFFDREHLPGGKIYFPYLPVLISERCPGVAMVLPDRWWPQALLNEIDARIDRARLDVWQSAWQTLAAGRTAEEQQNFVYRTQALERYARAGTSAEQVMQQLQYGSVPFRARIDPPPFEWEWDLSSELSSYAECLLTEVEIDRARGLPFNQARARQAFAASALAQRINLHRLLLCKRRGVDSQRLRLDPDHIQYTALGFAAGMEEAALESARLYCLAWQFDDFYAGLMRPEVRAVFVLFAAHLAMPIPDLKPFRPTPQLDALVDDRRWRSSDGDEICAMLEAACAEHMRLAPTGPFQGLPAAILLIFKLRQLSDLATPALTNPLFASPLLLPERGTNSNDTGELLARVRQRMCSNGFNEQLIQQAMETHSPLVVDSSRGALPVPDQQPQVVHLGVEWIGNEESDRLEKAQQRQPALFGFMLCAGLAMLTIMLLPAASGTLRPALWVLLIALGWRSWKYLKALLG